MELLELEHDVNKTVLLEALKEQWHGDSETEQADKTTEKAVTTMMYAARYGKLDELKQELGDEKGIQREAEKEVKQEAEKRHAENDRKKKEFVRRATELHEKRFALVDLEKQLGNLK